MLGELGHALADAAYEVAVHAARRHGQHRELARAVVKCDGYASARDDLDCLRLRINGDQNTAGRIRK